MFFEGNGGAMTDLAMSAAPDVRNGFPLLDRAKLPLLTTELKYNLELREYFTDETPEFTGSHKSDQSFAVNEPGRRHFYKGGKPEFCAKFKALSMAALSGPSPSLEERDSPPPASGR
jgi:hypothetical protein